MLYLPKARLTLSAPKLRTAARSFNGRTPRLDRGNLSSSLSLASTSEPKSKSIRAVGKHWLTKPAVIIRRDLKEICNPATVEGRAEYWFRTMLMWIRQDGWCCFREYDFCPGRLTLADCTFEHEQKRGASKRDDRIWLPETRKPINGACHGMCNSIVGSSRLEIFHGTNIVTDVNHG